MSRVKGDCKTLPTDSGCTITIKLDKETTEASKDLLRNLHFNTAEVGLPSAPVEEGRQKTSAELVQELQFALAAEKRAHDEERGSLEIKLTEANEQLEAAKLPFTGDGDHEQQPESEENISTEVAE